MAREADDARYEAIAAEYDRLRREVRSAEAALASWRRGPAAAAATVEGEVEAALGLLDEIERLSSDEAARTEVNPLLESLGVRIGLTFGGTIKGKKRVVRRLLGGVMVFGGAALPVRPHGAANLGCSVPAPCRGHGGAGYRVAEGVDGPAGGVHRAPGSAGGGRSECREGGAAVAGGDRVPIRAARTGIYPARPSGSRAEGISITKESRGERI
jgi:hypothetical protein